MPLRLIPDIHRATHRIGLYLEGVRDLGVNQAEAHILAYLAESSGDVTIGDLHHAFAHKRSTLTSILDRLDSRGLIVRESHRQDRRTFLIRLTAPGKKLARKVHAALERLEAVALGNLSKREIETIASALSAVANDSAPDSD